MQRDSHRAATTASNGSLLPTSHPTPSYHPPQRGPSSCSRPVCRSSPAMAFGPKPGKPPAQGRKQATATLQHSTHEGTTSAPSEGAHMTPNGGTALQENTAAGTRSKGGNNTRWISNITGIRDVVDPEARGADWRASATGPSTRRIRILR